MPNTKRKVSLLINMIAPARLALYASLAEHFDLQILHGGTESNRDFWKGMDEALPNARTVRVWGWQVTLPRKERGKAFDRRYVHINPGYVSRLLSFHPDAVITNEMGLRTLIALIYGTAFRKPVWVWWGGTLHTERKAGVARRAMRALICRWARHWISYGQTSTEYLLSLGIDRDCILEIQNAVDEALFAADARPDLDLRPRPVLLCVGQLIRRKGVEQLLRAAADVQKEGLDFSLVLVGSGPEKTELEKLAETIELKDVHFLRARSPQQMPAVYRSVDVLVLPTLEDVWGLVANEAMLCGVTVLCSKYAGCARELLPSQNIFDPENGEEFRRKLREAVRGQLPKPDCSRLKSTPQLAGELIRALETSMSAPVADLRGTARPGFHEQ